MMRIPLSLKMDMVRKLLVNVCRHFYEDFNLEVSIARFHNIYGPLGTYDGVEKKLLLLYVEKLLRQKFKMMTILIFGEMAIRLEVLYINIA